MSAADVGLDDVLMIAPGAIRFVEQDGQILLRWAQDGRQVRLSSSAMRLVSEFAIPTTVATVCVSVGGSPAAQATLVAAARRLVVQGVLTPFQPSSAATRGESRGLFGVPVSSLTDALLSAPDAVIVGVPYDLGVTYRGGTKFAPEYIRRISTSVFEARDADSRGMVDPVTGRRVLEGVRLRDIGDIGDQPGNKGADLLDTLEDVVALIAAAGSVPVVLGGDHSLTLRVVDGLTRGRDDIGVLHFDAHHDYGHVRTGPRDDVHHGNFMGWVLANPSIKCVAQLGVRQLTAEPPQESGKLRTWPGLSALEESVENILESLPRNLRWHVTFDVDVLDPSVMPTTGTLLPGGWTHREAARLLTGLCSRLHVVGVDVVEFLPLNDEGPAATVSDLIRHVLDAALATDGPRR